MVNDSLSDFITRVRNGYMAKMADIEVPRTRVIEKVAEVLLEEGYISGVKKTNGKNLIINLKYEGRNPVVTGIRRISSPGARIYKGVSGLPKVWGGLGINILSTPKGIMSDKKAKKLNCGGELLAQVW